MNHNASNLFLALCLLAFILCQLSLGQVEIRYLKPPVLEDMHLGKEVLCHCPVRHGAPNMSVEVKGDKIIFHNYVT